MPLAGCQTRGPDDEGTPTGADGGGTETGEETTTVASPTETVTPAPTEAATASPTGTATPRSTIAVTPSPDLPDMLLVNERPGTVNVDLSIESVESGGATVQSRVFMTREDTDGVGLPPGEVRVVVETDGASATERFETAPDRTLVVRVFPDRIEFSTVARK